MKFSIIIPHHNRSKYIQETISTVEAQTYENWELIIVDDNSDESEYKTLVQQVQTNHKIRLWRRLKAEEETSQGASIARNIGVYLSTGDYYIFLDSDDLLHPKALETRRQHIMEAPQQDFYVHQTQLFTKEMKDRKECVNDLITKEDDIDRFLRQDVPWSTSAVTWNATFIESLELWDQALPSWQDFDISIRALIKSKRYSKKNVIDSYWRVPQEPTIGSKSVSKKHLESHNQLLSKIYVQLEDNNLLNETRHKTILSLYIWLINTALKQHSSRKIAVASLKHAKQLNLTTNLQFFLLYLLLYVKQVSGRNLSLLVKIIIGESLPPVFNSKTFRNIKHEHTLRPSSI